MMMRLSRQILSIVALLCAAAVSATAQTEPRPVITIATDHPDSMFKLGEAISFTISIEHAEKIPAESELTYRVVSNGEQAEGAVEISPEAQTVTATATAPGFVFCEVTLTGPIKMKTTHYAGVSPELLSAQTPCPPDFMAFWQKQIARQADVPINAVVTPVEIPQPHLVDRVKGFDVRLDSAGGLPVTAYLTMPADASETKKYPIRVSFHGHTYFPRNGSHLKATEAVVHKMIFLDVNSHGLANGRPLEYYQETAWQDLRGQAGPYPYRDWDDLEKIYFNGMFLRVIRALEYARTLPEWDGRNLIVEGSSMGASQALVAAALDPQVSACVANVPAMADQHANYPGWPSVLQNAKADPDIVRKHAPYYDMVNFALQIKAPTLIGVGLNDSLCPPPTVWAIHNNLQGPKSMIVSVQGVHNWNPEMREAYPKWIVEGLR